MTRATTCHVCGRKLAAFTPWSKRNPTGRRGRPPQYHPPCKAFQDRLTMLAQAVEKLPPLTRQAARTLAAELILVRNLVRPHVNTRGREKTGEAIRTRREALGLSQEGLASRVSSWLVSRPKARTFRGKELRGLKRQQLSRFECGTAYACKGITAALDAVFAGWTVPRQMWVRPEVAV